jgi:hypothetical protein
MLLSSVAVVRQADATVSNSQNLVKLKNRDSPALVFPNVNTLKSVSLEGGVVHPFRVHWLWLSGLPTKAWGHHRYR